MSFDRAEYLFRDGARFHGQYNGTVDLQGTAMYATEAERDQHWRELNPEPCNCVGEECIAVSHYGGGFFWRGTACRKHMLFQGPCGYDDGMDDTDLPHEDWSPEDLWKLVK